jgi:hypothetical protein
LEFVQILIASDVAQPMLSDNGYRYRVSSSKHNFVHPPPSVIAERDARLEAAAEQDACAAYPVAGRSALDQHRQRQRELEAACASASKQTAMRTARPRPSRLRGQSSTTMRRSWRACSAPANRTPSLLRSCRKWCFMLARGCSIATIARELALAERQIGRLARMGAT